MLGHRHERIAGSCNLLGHRHSRRACVCVPFPNDQANLNSHDHEDTDCLGQINERHQAGGWLSWNSLKDGVLFISGPERECDVSFASDSQPVPQAQPSLKTAFGNF